MTTTLLRPAVSASVTRPLIVSQHADDVVKVEGGDITIDAHAFPYAQGTVVVPLDTSLELQELDPRDDVRVQVDAAEQVGGTSRSFNLGLRRRSVDHTSKVIRCTVASDEALLTDYAALVEDNTPRQYETSLRMICDYVIGRATGNLLPFGTPWVDTSGWISSVSGGTGGTVTLTRNGSGTAAVPYYYNLTLTGGTGPFTFFQAYSASTSPENRVPVTPGHTYSAQTGLWANTTKRISIGIEFRTAANASLGISSFTSYAPSNQWITATTAPAIAPATAAYAVLVIRANLDNPAVGDRVGFTTAKLGEGNTPPGSITPGAPDADVTAQWDLENFVTNPTFEVDAAGTAISANASGLASVVPPGLTPISGTKSLRATATAAGSSTFFVAGFDASSSAFKQIRVKPGEVFTASLHLASSVARSSRIILGFRDENNGSVGVSYASAFAATQVGAWTRYSITGTSPTGAAFITLSVETSANTAGQFHYVDGVMVTDGAELVPYFDGLKPNDARYTYAFTGTAHASSSTRKAVVERPPEMFIWKPGTTAWDFLQPFTTAAAMRLFCDELRKWRLIDPYTYTIAGVVSVGGFNATDGVDTIGRDDPEIFATSVVARYTWIDPRTGQTRVAYDVAGTPGKTFVRDYARPYPGPGAAAAMLKRRNGTGRVQDVTALVNWRTTPAMTAQISLPGAPIQQGPVVAVRFSLGDDALMDVSTSGLVDTPAGAIDLLKGTIDALVGSIDAQNPT